MSRDKQIEEMVKELSDVWIVDWDGNPHNLSEKLWNDDLENIAIELYNIGYRKSTNLAEEIFAEIEKTLNRKIARSKPRFEKLKNRDEDFLSKWGCEDMGYFKGVISTCEDFQDIIAELKKKYIGEDTNVPANTEGER